MPGSDGLARRAPAGLPGGGAFVQASRSGFTLGAKLPFDVTARRSRRERAAPACRRPRRGPRRRGPRPGRDLERAGPALAADSEWSIAGKAVALSDGGHARRGSSSRPRGARDQTRLRVTRRAPGGSFGAGRAARDVVRVDRLAARDRRQRRRVRAVWTDQSSTPPIRVPVRLATHSRAEPSAHPAARRHPVAVVAALAVAPDGRALAVMPDGTSLLLAERAPGEPFGS